MTYWNAGSAAVGAAANYFGNKGSSHDNDPMAPIDLYEQSAQAGVRGVNRDVGNLEMQKWYPDSTVASMNPNLTGALTGMTNWGQPGGMGDANMNTNYFAGHGALEGGLRGGMTMMDQLSNQPGGPFQYGQGVFNQTMGNLMPAMQGTYDAMSRDNNRALNWQTLPGINMGAAGAGQQGGTKGAQQSALAQGMTMDRNADIGASLYQNAVNQSNQNAMMAGQQNLSGNLNLINQYGNMAQFGGNLLNQAYNQGVGNQNQALSAGQIGQGYDQSVVDANVARWNFNEQQPYDYLKNRMDIFNMSKAGGYGQRGPEGLNSFEALTQGAMGGVGAYQMGQDAGWWGQPQQTGYNPGMNPMAVQQNTNNGYYGSQPGGGLIPDYNW